MQIEKAATSSLCNSINDNVLVDFNRCERKYVVYKGVTGRTYEEGGPVSSIISLSGESGKLMEKNLSTIVATGLWLVLPVVSRRNEFGPLNTLISVFDF